MFFLVVLQCTMCTCISLYYPSYSLFYIWWFNISLIQKNNSIIISLNITLPFSLFSFFENSFIDISTNLNYIKLFFIFSIFHFGYFLIIMLQCDNFLYFSGTFKILHLFLFLILHLNLWDFYLILLYLNLFLMYIYLFFHNFLW